MEVLAHTIFWDSSILLNKADSVCDMKVKISRKSSEPCSRGNTVVT